MPENYPIYPVLANLYVFDLDLNMLEAKATGTRIRAIHAEANDETFIIVTDRLATGYYVGTADVLQYPDLTNGETFYVMRMTGDEPEGGVYHFSMSIGGLSWNGGELNEIGSLTLEKFCPKAATWAWDASPNDAIEATFPAKVPGSFGSKITIEGPALKDGYCGLITAGTNANSNPFYPLSYGFYANRTGDLTPQWCIARMDLGLTLQDRTDLESDAQDIVEMGDYYYVVTKGLRPYTQWPAGISLHPPGANANFFHDYTIMYFPTPSANIPDPTTKYVECTGGEAVLQFVTHTKAVPIKPGTLPLATNAINNIAVYAYGEQGVSGVRTVMSTSMQLLAYRFSNPTTATPLIGVANLTVQGTVYGGGAAQRVTPRRNLYKLKKDDLSIVDAGEWDHSLYTSTIESNQRLGTAGDSLVITGTATKRIKHLLDTRYIGGRDQILYPQMPQSIPVVNYEVTFTLNGNPITGTQALSGVMRPTGGVISLGVATALMAYFGPGTIEVQSDDTLRFVGTWHATEITGLGYRIESIVDPDEPVVSGLFPNNDTALRGAPDALRVQPFYSTVNLSANFWTFIKIEGVESPRTDEFLALTIAFTKDGQEISSCPLVDVLYPDRFGPIDDGDPETVDDFYDEYGGPFDPVKVIEQLAGEFGASNLHIVGSGYQNSAISYDGTDPSVVHCKVGYVIKGTWSNYSDVGLLEVLASELGTDIDGDIVPDKPVVCLGEFNSRPVSNNYVAAAMRSGFTYGWDISGRLKPEQTYRIRYQTTPGYSIQFAQGNFGALSGGVAVTYIRFTTTSSCKRADTFKIWYDGNASAPITIDFVTEYPSQWYGNGLYDPLAFIPWDGPTGAGTRIAAAVTALTGVTWRAMSPSQNASFFQIGSGGIIYRSLITDILDSRKIYEIDPLWQYTPPIRMDTSVEAMEGILKGIGFTNARLITRTTLMNGPIRFVHYNGLMTPIEIDLGDDNPGNSRVIVGPDFEEEEQLHGDQIEPTPPYPETGRGLTAAQTIVSNAFGEYFVYYPTGFQQEGPFAQQYMGAKVVKYSPQHAKMAEVQVVTGSGQGATLVVDRFHNLIVTAADTLKIYDRNLDVVGVINRPTNILDGVWGRVTSLYQFYGNAITDRHQNYYVFGYNGNGLVIFKFNQLFQYVASFELSPEFQYGTQGRQLICVGDHLVMAKLGILQSNSF